MLSKEQTLNKCYKECAAATGDDGDGGGDNGDGGGDSDGSGPQGRTGTFPRPQR